MSITLGWTEIFRSVELIWLIWAVSMLALWLMVRRLSREKVVNAWRELLTQESGAAYTVSYVFSFPIFMLLVCTVIETSLVLVVKIGTMYACFAGARSAAVWIPAQPNVAQEKIRLAVVHALTPFAEGTPFHTKRMGIVPTVTSDGLTYHRAYERYAGDRSRAGSKYLAQKYSYAESTVRIAAEKSADGGDVTLTITYPMPLHIPGAARILGYPDGVYPITSRAVIQIEEPKQEDGSDPEHPLGIEYQSLP